MSLFIKLYLTSSMLNMFRTLIRPSSGTCDFSILSPHWLYVLVSMCVGVSVWLVGVVSVLQAEVAYNTDITPTQPHRNSNTPRTKNNTTNVVIQRNSRKLLMVDILMSETCLALKPATRIPLQPNHTETPTHIEPRTIRPMWWYNRIVASSWWWMS